MPTGIELTRQDVGTDGKGNVTSMPLLVGKPCFGIPAAYLRHGRARSVYVRDSGMSVHNSRCDRCNAHDACVFLAKERLRSLASQDAEFANDLKMWAKGGGITRGGFERASKVPGIKVFNRIASKLASANFKSTNDQQVREYWKERAEKAAIEERGKERYAMRKAWKNMQRLPELTKGLDCGAADRECLLRSAMSGPNPPKYLRRVPDESVERIAAVWWAREFARQTGQALNPSRYARIIIEQRLDGHIIPHGTLRQMVPDDLKRIRQLEADAKYNGGSAIWPKFKHPALI